MTNSKSTGALITLIVGACAVVVALVVSLLVSPSISGDPLATPASETQSRLEESAAALASEPGLAYEGTIDTDDDSVGLEDFQVAANGDAYGVITRAGGRGEWLQIGGESFLKADAAFWDDVDPRDDDDNEAGIDFSLFVDQWTSVSPTELGFDPSKLLRPAALALNSAGLDGRLGDLEIDVTGDANAPDRRSAPTTDPAETYQDGDVITVGGTEFTLENGTIVGITGPIGPVVSDRERPISRLKVRVLTSSGVQEFYSTIRNLSNDLQRIPTPRIFVPKPTGGLNCAAACVLTYNFINFMPTGDRGEVTVVQTTRITMNGRPIGNCTERVRMAPNRGGRTVCTVPFTPLRVDMNFDARSNFLIQGYAETDVRVIVESVDRGVIVADTAKGWTPTTPIASPAGRAYNEQITGTPSSFVFMVGDFGFDGRESDGTLLVARGPGYDDHVGVDRSFDTDWAGRQALLDDARAAREAAGDQDVRFVFAESNAADAMRTMLADEGVDDIEVVAVRSR